MREKRNTYFVWGFYEEEEKCVVLGGCYGREEKYLVFWGVVQGRREMYSFLWFAMGIR